MKRKMPIAWHNACYLNAEFSYYAKIGKHEALLREIERDKQALEFYKKQIETAKEVGLDGFDPQRYLKRKSA